MRLIIFTDLDATLLDHDTYDWEPAQRMLDRIRAQGWPLVFVTSKTRAEVERIRLDMELDQPFVVENGAAAFFPSRFDHVPLPTATRMGSYRVLVFGRPYGEVRAFLTPIRDKFGIEGFGDMELGRIQETTGLSPEAAALAARREFTEPFLVDDASVLPALSVEAARAGFALTTGGRFQHLIGADQGKGTAVLAVRGAFADAWGDDVQTIGLGDGPNDVPMLEAVDYPIVVPAPGRAPPAVDHPRVQFAPGPGPEGWSAALETLFDTLSP